MNQVDNVIPQPRGSLRFHDPPEPEPASLSPILPSLPPFPLRLFHEIISVVHLQPDSPPPVFRTILYIHMGQGGQL